VQCDLQQVTDWQHNALKFQSCGGGGDDNNGEGGGGGDDRFVTNDNLYVSAE
jgi:hypothetical protein